ncbi:MAG: hypothetical protein LUI60_03150 [Clostridia bacterium]|nr:hypothetical protein [Clostridia bacterium]
MRGEFGKIKTKYLRRAIIYGVAGGLCCSFAVTGAVMLALKLSKIVWGWYLYLALALGVAAATGIIIFLSLRISDKKLAKKLDEKYGLDEKTQTLVEYEDRQSVMLDMQRADAEAALRALPKRRPAVWNILLHIVIALLCVALFVAGIAVPQKRENVEPIVEEPYTVDESQLERLTALIENLTEDTTLESALHQSYIDELNALYSRLTEDGITELKMEEYVQSTMYAVSDLTIDYTTYDDMAYQLTVADSMVYMAEALRESAAVYTEINSSLTLYSTLAANYEKMFSYIADKMDGVCGSFDTEMNALTDDTVVEKLAPYITALENALKADGLSTYYNALFTDGGITLGSDRGSVSSGDDLYDALYDLYYSINRVSKYYGSRYNDATSVINLLAGGTGSIYTFASAAAYAMEAQAYAYMEDVYVRQTLSDIFGVEMVGTQIEDGSAEEDDNTASGGATGGTGEAVYPGDDKLYNPETLDYSYYYEMLQNYGYLAALQELLYSDDISDEVKSFISAYINNLLSGS